MMYTHTLVCTHIYKLYMKHDMAALISFVMSTVYIHVENNDTILNTMYYYIQHSYTNNLVYHFHYV